MRRLDRLALALALVPSRALAFTFESPFTDGCHERITRAALARAGWPSGARPPGLSSNESLRLARDLAFALPADAQDPWSLALLLGARDNDLHGYAADDAQELAAVHAAPEDQREHCLRAPTDDGPDGNRSALVACRGFIVAELTAALGSTPALDLAATEPHTVTLPFTGRRAIAVQRYGWHMGRALHALQDSFAHAFRTPDGRRVRHVLNYVDHAQGRGYDEARDGHDHIAALDGCDPASLAEAHRVARATDASAELLRAVAEGSANGAERVVRGAAIVDAWTAIEPGCTVANRYCAAPELSEGSAGCAAGPRSAPRSKVPLFASLTVVAALLRARRRTLAALTVAAALALIPRGAHAQTPSPATPNEPGLLAMRALVGASIDRGAMAVSLGAHLRVSSRLSLGLTAEYNPWYSFATASLFTGVFNAYLTGSFAWRRVGNVVLHSSLSAGTSVLLADLIGADAGTVGVYVGASVLGLTVDLSRHVHVVVLPATVSVPIPQLSGVPILYQQYRFSIGFEWDT
jgi:hypothetical protein